ncbi:unannotated protein [freshwater metagenome]|uniref:Unannotated protein n=1 Tax=freshwater metagenome TaxID=449393 RepID=A0A6J6I3Q3_9ZZZZ
MSSRKPSLGRRIFPAIALSAVGVGMVNVLDRPNSIGALGGATTPTIDPAISTTVVAPGTNAPITAQTVSTVAPTTAAPSTGGTSAPAVTAPPTTAVPVTVAPATNDCGALTGTGASTTIAWRRDYGVLQVTAKFTSAGVICHASAQYQTYDSRSDRYESYAIPIMNKQAVSAGSANIQGVSGATGVSGAYKTSLQSAIDNKK